MLRKTVQALQAQVNKLKKLCISSTKQPVYVPPHLRKDSSFDTSSQDTEADHEKSDKDVHKNGQALTTTVIHQIYQDFHTAPHRDHMLHLPEFNGNSLVFQNFMGHNGDVFMD